MSKSKRLRAAVTGSDAKGWDFTCPVNDNTCGPRDKPDVSFTSTGWPTRAIAEERGQEHFTEHITGSDPDVETVIASSLEEFRAKHKLVPSSDGKRAVVTAKDL